MDINKEWESQALQEAAVRFPHFAGVQARIVARPLFQGFAWMLEYADPASKQLPDAWEFQNAAVKAYRKLAGV